MQIKTRNILVIHIFVRKALQKRCLLAYAGLWDEIIEAIVRVNYIESTTHVVILLQSFVLT